MNSRRLKPFNITTFQMTVDGIYIHTGKVNAKSLKRDKNETCRPFTTRGGWKSIPQYTMIGKYLYLPGPQKFEAEVRIFYSPEYAMSPEPLLG